MSSSNPTKEAADEEKLLGNAAYKVSNFDEAIAHYQDAWEIYPDVVYKNNEATSRYQKGDYAGAIAASLNGIENGEEETATPPVVAKALGRIGMCYTAMGDFRKGLEYFEKSVEKDPIPAIESKLARLKLEVGCDREVGDAVAKTVLDSFAKLPKKRKPLEGGGKKEWVPLAGIVAQVGDKMETISLGTGMKCLPFSKLSSAAGRILHDWHAEVVCLRSLNYFFLQEVNKTRGEGKFLHSPQESLYIRKLSFDERKNTLGRWHRDTPDYHYTIREGVRLHMYCSEAPCGDASMELTMASQEDATPWEVTTDGEGGLPGRGGFGQLGIVRRKPSRPDAPECRSKSCSDKLAQKQMTSVLNTLSALLISPQNAYLETFTIPESQYVHWAWQRCFSSNERLQRLQGIKMNGGYAFRPFKALTTSQEFEYSRRSLGPDGAAPKPSNIACAWSPHHDETIINGILQGCKMTNPLKPEASSVTSRYNLWHAMEDSSLAGDYGAIKTKKRLAARAAAKEAIRSVMMQGREWVANTGDERWARETETEKRPIGTGCDEAEGISDSEHSDAVTDQTATLAMAIEMHPTRILRSRMGKRGLEYKLKWLSEVAMQQERPGSREEDFAVGWRREETWERWDSEGRLVAAFEREEREVVEKNRRAHPPCVHKRRKREGGEEEFEFGELSEVGERSRRCGSKAEHFNYEWLSREELGKRDPSGEALETFEREEAETLAYINSEETKKRHAFGDGMLERMENDDWEGYDEGEYYEAHGMENPNKKV